MINIWKQTMSNIAEDLHDNLLKICYFVQYTLGVGIEISSKNYHILEMIALFLIPFL